MRKIGSPMGRTVFESIRESGSVIDGNLLRFIYRFGPHRFPPIQTGVIVGKRHGHATQRNFLRRRIREACRLLLGPLSDDVRASPPSLSLIIVYRGSKLRAGSRVTFHDLKRDVEEFINAVRKLHTSE